MVYLRVFCFTVFLIVSFNQLNAQNSATTKPSSYFTVDANAEQTSTQNWWGDNVDNGNEPTTASPPSGITSSGVSPASVGQAITGANVQAAGVVPVESATVSGSPDSSSPSIAADDGNSTQSSANSNFLGTSTFIFIAYTILY